MSDTNYQFSRFGSKMIPLAILSIISLIFSILAFISAIFYLVVFIFLIIITSIAISAIRHAKEANSSLNDPDLENFHLKVKKAVILGLIGFFFLTLAMILFSTNAPWLGIFPGIPAFILLLISLIFKIQGWGGLSSFFKRNKSMFPENIGSKGSTGATLLMIGAIFYLLGPAMFIGMILEVIGYFMLSSLKDLGGEPGAKPAAQPTAAPVKAKTPAEPAKAGGKGFCPNCGSPVEGKEKYCGSCGSEI